MNFSMKTYMYNRHRRLVRERKCIECTATHDTAHVRCPDCHQGHLEASRIAYTPKGTGYLCGACGNTGHNRRTCQQVRAA